MYAIAGIGFEAAVQWGEAGLTEELGVKIMAPSDVELVGHTTEGIVEKPAGSGYYTKAFNAIENPGSDYKLVWDKEGGDLYEEPLIVVTELPAYTVGPGENFESTVEGFPSGLEGVIGYRIVDVPTETTIVARTTVGVTEPDPGVYQAFPVAPDDLGSYSVVWDSGTLTPQTVAATDLVVSDEVQSVIPKGGTFQASAILEPGLEGTVGVRLIDTPAGATVVARTTAGIKEEPDGSGNYAADLVAPMTAGTYTVFFDEGTITPSTISGEQIIVFAPAVGTGGLVTGEDTLTPTVPDGTIPSNAEVGELLRARTKDTNGKENGVFTANTRPTAAGATTMILIATNDVLAEVGTDFAGTEIIRQVRSLIILRAAMLIELSYFPEQVRSDKSAYDRYERMYNQRLKGVLQAVNDAEDTATDSGPGDQGFPSYAFPEDVGGMVGWGTRW